MISFTITVPDQTPPPPPPDPVDGDWINEVAVLTARNAKAAAHGIGVSEETGFVGFASLTGFTDVPCANASAVKTAIEAAGINGKIRCVCNWNGVSVPSNASINGPSNTALTTAGLANGAVDIGYDRPLQSIRIEPGDGFAPIIGVVSSDTSWIFNGMNFVEIRDIGFEGILAFERSASRPLLACVATHGVTLHDTQMKTRGVRSAHHVDTLCIGLTCQITTGAQYWRSWGAEFIGKTRASDNYALAGYTEAYKVGWIAHHWTAGNILHNPVYQADTGNHMDFQQGAISTEVAGFGGYSVLFEFNMINGDCDASQGLFYAQGKAGQTLSMVAHNNVILINAWAGIHANDPEGAGEMYLYRNLIARAPRGTTPPAPPTPIFQNDTRPRIIISNRAGSDGGGFFDVRENILGSVLRSNVSADVYEVGNVEVSAQNAANGSPISQLTVLTGNDTWTVNYAGYNISEVIETTQDRATSFTEIAAWAMPVGGWRTGDAGPVDPATWPDRNAPPLVME
jgi:hypothetical protein